MSPRFHAQSLNMHLSSRIGSALILASLVLYLVATIGSIVSGTDSLQVWPDTLIALLMLSVCGVPASRYILHGTLG